MGTRVSRKEYFDEKYYTRWYVFSLPSSQQINEIMNVNMASYNYYDLYKRWDSDFQHPCSDWCVENLSGEFTLSTAHISIKNKKDAMLFKLVWG